MKIRHEFLKIALKKAQLQDARNEFENLKEGAFKIFDASSIEEIEEIWETYWKRILMWNIMQGAKYNLPFLSIDSSDLNEAYVRVGYFTRTELMERFEKAREVINRYIEMLDEKIGIEEEKMKELYDEFAGNTGALSEIFENPGIRSLILNVLLAK